MKTQEKTIIELRSKEKTLDQTKRRWLIKKETTGSIWKHYCDYSEEWTMVHFVKETKRGFTFSVYFAGKYTDHFISRSDVEIIYEL